MGGGDPPLREKSVIVNANKNSLKKFKNDYLWLYAVANLFNFAVVVIVVTIISDSTVTNAIICRPS